eukprot:NODE_4_length_77007_cov_1.156642.p27 type:complete len:329 gc:universal NODE_4_length_77007_cov_1.156642:52718-53704(+)
MKSFILEISNLKEKDNKFERISITEQELDDKIILLLLELLNGKSPNQTLPGLVYYLSSQKSILLIVLSVYYQFIKSKVNYDVLLDTCLLVYGKYSQLPFAEKNQFAATISYWARQLRISRKVKWFWQLLPFRSVDRSLFDKIVEIEPIVPRSTSTLIDKKADISYEKVIPQFLNIPSKSQIIGSDKQEVDSKNNLCGDSEEVSLTTEPTNGYEPSLDQVANKKIRPTTGLPVDVLFLTKSKMAKYGKWIRATVVLNEFGKEIKLNFENGHVVPLVVENGYYTWKNSWVQFKLINGLRVILRFKGFFEIDNRLEVVQFAMDCKCQYFDD